MRILRVIRVLTFAAALSLGGTMMIAGEGSELPPFELTDQFGIPHRSGEISGRTVIVIGADRKGQSWSRAWATEVEALLSTWKDSEGGSEILRVADLRGTPRIGPIETRVSQRLREQSASVLMDWQGTLASIFGFESGVANVIVLDPRGRQIFRAQFTEVEPDGVERLEATLASQLGVDGRLRRETREFEETRSPHVATADLRERIGVVYSLWRVQF